MLILEFKKYFLLELSNLYPKTEIYSFFTLLVQFKLKKSRVELALHPSIKLNKNELDFFQKALIDLKKQIPIQYILGETEFYGLKFHVNNNVLIPRPETEELVQWIIEDNKKKDALKILDIGTGSGCIAITLAKNLPNVSVFALDVSKKALTTAKFNAKLNNVEIEFINSDILTLNKLSKKFDIIVSNPPYVRELEKEQMSSNVLANEPHLALFVKNNNALLFYEKITEFAKSHLIKNGKLYFEINQYLSAETMQLLSSKKFKNTLLKKDIFGNYRMVKGTFN
jgi:release factor glutamine methyltransferase